MRNFNHSNDLSVVRGESRRSAQAMRCEKLRGFRPFFVQRAAVAAGRAYCHVLVALAGLASAIGLTKGQTEPLARRVWLRMRPAPAAVVVR